MAEPLKDLFTPALLATLAADLRRAGLDPGDFEARALDGLGPLAFSDRARHIAHALRAVLPADDAEALAALVRTLGPPLGSAELEGLSAFRYWPHSFLIAELGPRAPEAGLRACHALTRRFTCEFCLRPIVESHPELVFRTLAGWVEDPDVHVRRAVSESLRPRLPWGSRLRALQADPTPSLVLLERLRDDPEPYVRRSVANHLGDIAKDHPDRVVALAREWRVGASPERLALLRHALRHPVKQGHAGALDALGFGGTGVEVRATEVPAGCEVGDNVRFAFAVRSTADGPQRLVVDLVVHFLKQRGRTGAKVFSLDRFELGAGETRTVAGRVRFAPLSTRPQHPGPHRVEAQVNGARFPLGTVDVRPAPAR